jgi:hypothetical protein
MVGSITPNLFMLARTWLQSIQNGLALHVRWWLSFVANLRKKLYAIRSGLIDLCYGSCSGIIRFVSASFASGSSLERALFMFLKKLIAKHFFYY